MSPLFSSSVICMDPLNLAWHIVLIEKLEIPLLHIDIMDGHNVPRFGLYPEQLERINAISNLPLDVHLMVDDVEFTLTQLKNVTNIENLVFHIEGKEGNLLRLLDAARKIATNVGVVVNMSTGPDIIKKLLRLQVIDSITFMAIHPGVLQQKSRPELLYSEIGETLSLNKHTIKYVSIDGGVTFDTIKPLLKAGANILVGGSGTIYKGVNFKDDNIDLQTMKITDNWFKIKKEMGI